MQSGAAAQRKRRGGRVGGHEMCLPALPSLELGVASLCLWLVDLNALTQDRFTQKRRHTRHPEQDRAGGGPEGAVVLPPIPLVSGAFSHCRSDEHV